MPNESPTARRARLERLFGAEHGRAPRDMDEFLDWYSGYCRRCEADAQRLAWLATAGWLQVEHRGPRMRSWRASDEPLAAWVDRQMAAETEVARVA